MSTGDASSIPADELTAVLQFQSMLIAQGVGACAEVKHDTESFRANHDVKALGVPACDCYTYVFPLAS